MLKGDFFRDRSASDLSFSLIFRIFFPFACGYFLSYLLRTINAVIASDLSSDLSLSAGSLGLLTSVYFVSFAAFQLPLGILLDRYGPRRTESFLLILAGLGSILFALSASLGGLIFSRALIGLGVSACLMAAFKAYSDWFPSDRLALAYGCQLTAGGLGALTATIPISYLMPIFGWRGIFWVLGFLSFAVSALLFLMVPRRGEVRRYSETVRVQVEGLGLIFRNRLFWRVAPLAVTVQATGLAELTLWTGPWLRDVGLFSEGEIAGLLFWIACFLTLGFVATGTVSDYLQRLGIPLFTTWIWGTLLCMMIQFFLLFSDGYLGVFLWMGFAFFGGTAILSYAGLSACFPSRYNGRLVTALNFLVFFLSFAGQWLIGWVIDFWAPLGDGRFSSTGYSVGFGLLLLSQCVSFLWLWLYRGSALYGGVMQLSDRD